MNISILRVGDIVSWIDGVGHETVAKVVEIPVEHVVVELTKPEGFKLSLSNSTPCVKEMRLINDHYSEEANICYMKADTLTSEDCITRMAKAMYFADSDLSLENKEKEWKADITILQAMYIRRARAAIKAATEKMGRSMAIVKTPEELTAALWTAERGSTIKVDENAPKN